MSRNLDLTPLSTFCKPENCAKDGCKRLEKTPDRERWNRAYRHDTNEGWDKRKTIESAGIQWTAGVQHHRGETGPEGKRENGASDASGDVNGKQNSASQKKEICG